MNENHLKRLFPNASPAFLKANCDTHGTLAAKPSHPIPEQACGSESIQSDEAKEGGKKRITVRITRLGTHLLDEDNLAGAKLLIDELRYAKLIPSDDAGTIKIELQQCKVSKAQIGTLIEIIP